MHAPVQLALPGEEHSSSADGKGASPELHFPSPVWLGPKMKENFHGRTKNSQAQAVPSNKTVVAVCVHHRSTKPKKICFGKAEESLCESLQSKEGIPDEFQTEVLGRFIVRNRTRGIGIHLNECHHEITNNQVTFSSQQRLAVKSY